MIYYIVSVDLSAGEPVKTGRYQGSVVKKRPLSVPKAAAKSLQDRKMASTPPIRRAVGVAEYHLGSQDRSRARYGATLTAT